MSLTIEQGLNDAGIEYIVDSRHICECGYSLPYDPLPLARSFNRFFAPNYERMNEHMQTCPAHQEAWEQDKRWCACHSGWVHKDYMLGGYCERCWEHGQ